MRIDVTITEYKRPELLAKTLESLQAPSLGKIIVHRDGLEGKGFSDDDFIELRSYPRMGQIAAYDKMMLYVTTEFVLACEEDFTCIGDLEEGLQEAVEILNRFPECVSVSLRGQGTREHNGHPHYEYEGILRMKDNFHLWSGFSFCPSVRRVSDYHRIGKYGDHTTWNTNHAWNSEKKIGHVYRDLE